MEALWNLEDKLKLTTQESVLLLTFTALAVVGLCMVTILKKKLQKQKVMDGGESVNSPKNVKRGAPSCNWVSIKRMLMGSVRWSGPTKWKEKTPPLLGVQEGREGGGVGWRSHNSTSPVWQRPILMGEKCELPRFSGLILYDEKGMPLSHSLMETSHKDDHTHQEKPAAVVRTTLRDLL